MPRRLAGPFVPCCVLALLAVPQCGAGDDVAPGAEGSLLHLVGREAGFCLEVPRLEETVREAWTSSLAGRVRELSLFRQWLAGDDHRRLVEARDGVERLIGRPVDRFAADLLGRQVVVALYPAPGEEPRGILLTRAASDTALRDAIETWNRLEHRQETTELSHAGRVYHRRVHRGETVYHAAIGQVLAVSEHEQLLRDVLERAEAATPSDGLAGSERYQRARAEIAADVAAFAYLDLRAWDVPVPEPDTGNPVEQFVADLVRRTDYVAAGLRIDEGAVLDVVVGLERHGRDASPPNGAEALSANGLLGRVPRRVLFLVVGRLDAAAAADALYGGLPPEERRRIEPWRRFAARRFLGGLDVIEDLLPAVGPEFGGYVVPRRKLLPGASPVEALLAVELVPATAGIDAGAGSADPRRVLDDLLAGGLDLWITVHNSGSAEATVAEVVTRDDEHVVLRWIEGLGPYKPGYALTERHLVFVSSPDLVEEFVAPRDGERLIDSEHFRGLHDRYLPRADQLVFLNLAEVRRFVAANRDFLLAELARSRGREPAATDLGPVRAEELLGLFDAGFVSAEIRHDGIRIVVGALGSAD